MKTFKLIVVLLISCLCAKANAHYRQNAENEIVIGVADSLYSEVLKEQRELWIHLPEDFNEAEKYPVIYLFDAKQHFYAVTEHNNIEWRIPGLLTSNR